MDRLRIGVVFGGSSEEHPVSVKSAQEVARSLDPARYEPWWIGITAGGEWRLCDGPVAGWDEGPGRTAVLSPDRSVHGLLVLDGERHEEVRLDVVLPVLHGRLGEDGAVQGLLDLSGIPYVGCDVQASALCMDKSLAYTVVAEAGIPTPTFWILDPGDEIDPGVLPYPVFVKPARSGSSFGVSKVTSAAELDEAVATARQYDEKVLIEEGVVAEEIG
ncbi:MAG TPA: D-alanine--(R)-lactate ligase, partial [Marmoricola sp.]